MVVGSTTRRDATARLLAAAGALSSVPATFVGAQPAFSGCNRAQLGFWVNGTLQGRPCPVEVSSTGALLGSKRLYACSEGGAYLCDGHGGDWPDPAVPVNCTAVGLLGCRGTGLPPQVEDVAFSPAGDAVYAACDGGFAVTRCAWDAATGTASNCADIASANCKPSGAPHGVAVAPDDPTQLVVHCLSPVRNSLLTNAIGVMICTLAAPGSGALAAGTGCDYRGDVPCTDILQQGPIGLDPEGRLIFTCTRDGYRVCNYSATSGPFNCSVPWGPSPCDGHLAGVHAASTGRTVAACRNGSFAICGNAHPTLSPSLLQTGPPSLSPSLAAGQPTVLPSAPPSASPSVPPRTVPSAPPSLVPGAHPISEPTVLPRASPVTVPTAEPSASHPGSPSAAPSARRSSESQPPSRAPLAANRETPGPLSSRQPTAAPSSRPVFPTTVPVFQPPSAPAASPGYGSPDEKAPRGYFVADDELSVVLAAGSGVVPGLQQVSMVLDTACDELGTLQNMPRVLHPTQWNVDGSAYLGCILAAIVIVSSAIAVNYAAVSAMRMCDGDDDGLISRADVPRTFLRFVPGVKNADGIDIAGLARFPNIIIAAVAFVYQGAVFSALRMMVSADQSFWRRVLAFCLSAVALAYAIWMRRRVRAGADPAAPDSGAQPVPLARLRRWDHPRPPVLLQYAVLSELGDWVSCRRERHWVLSWKAAVQSYRPCRATGAVTVEYLTMWCLGLANAPETPTFAACGHVRIASAVILFAQLVYTAARCPHHAARDTAFVSVRIVATITALLLLVDDFYNERTETDKAETLLKVAIALALAASIIVVLRKVILQAAGWRSRLQDAEWRSAHAEPSGGAVLSDTDAGHREDIGTAASPTVPGPGVPRYPQLPGQFASPTQHWSTAQPARPCPLAPAAPAALIAPAPPPAAAGWLPTGARPGASPPADFIIQPDVRLRRPSDVLRRAHDPALHRADPSAPETRAQLRQQRAPMPRGQAQGRPAYQPPTPEQLLSPPAPARGAPPPGPPALPQADAGAAFTGHAPRTPTGRSARSRSLEPAARPAGSPGQHEGPPCSPDPEPAVAFVRAKSEPTALAPVMAKGEGWTLL
eukprot:TRINITY_DN13692_c0_g1_i1.p1 TRINITY_DN13692_c0_g1~~TRINITY_DN13692_c0_g1_i1.p1  ORF type:complete len:1120 (+),score=82.57 TRINITY_DN13692_c0_g1_i1:61-3360(+)